MMRGVYYLKILLLYLYLSLNGSAVQGAAFSKVNDVAKKLLMAKSLPFEDCGEC